VHLRLRGKCTYTREKNSDCEYCSIRQRETVPTFGDSTGIWDNGRKTPHRRAVRLRDSTPPKGRRSWRARWIADSIPAIRFYASSAEAGLHDYLRQLHRDICRKLQQVPGSTVSDKRADAFFRSAAEEIGGALKVLAEISNSAQEQVPRVVFEVSVVCSDCTLPPDTSKDDPGTGVPEPGPVFLLELDHLCDSANRSGRRRARRMRHKNSRSALSKGHQKLVAH
jgi:hypothetical protein